METEKDESKYIFNEFKRDSIDRNGRTIEEIELKIPDVIVIYLIKDDYFSLGIDMRDDLDIKLPKDLEIEMNSLNDLVSEKNCKKKKFHFVRDAYSSAYLSIVNQIEFSEINGNYSELETEFDSEVAISYINNAIEKLKRRNRKKFILGLLIPVIIISFFSISIYYYNFLNLDNIIKIAIYSILFSNLGSMLKQLLNVSNLDCFNAVGFMDGVLDFLKSSISGLLLFLVIKANILLGSFNNNVYAILAFSIASGFNDDIPLRIISRLSDKLEKDEEVIKDE